MSKPYFRLSDAQLLNWSNAFAANLNLAPATYDLTPAQVTAFMALATSFDTALAAWDDQSSKTPVASANKKAARLALVNGAKFLVNMINSNPATTDAMRQTLGINLRKIPSPIPQPDVSPMIDIISVKGQTVTLGLHTTGRRGRPSGVQGASVFTYVGAEAPADMSEWNFEGLITRTTVGIAFPQSSAASTAWVTAFWYNGRGQSGPACAPVSVNLPASSPVPQGETLKIAA